MTGEPCAARVAVVGFGELGRALVETVCSAGLAAPRVYTRPRHDTHQAAAQRASVSAAGGEWSPTLSSALACAEVVLVCVPGSEALAIAEQAGPRLPPKVLYVDLCSAAPDVKQQAARIVGAARCSYVDAAVLGAVAASAGRVPVLASGEGAAELARIAPDLGMDVTAIDGPVGAAARVKLLRSVYLKGRDALVAEMVTAARQLGLERIVVESIRGPGEEVTFPALSQRVLASLALHAPRRADELRASAALLRSSGVEPLATEGAESRLRRHATTAPP